MQLISEMLETSARRYGPRVFLDDGERTLTYGGFLEEVCRLAQVLADLGARAGEPVGIYLPSSIDLVLAYHACQRLGAVAMPLSAMNKLRELEQIARRTDLEVLVTGTAGAELAVATKGSVPSLRCVVDLQGSAAGTEDGRLLMSQAHDDFPLARRDPGGPAALFFTSGTTGAPKGIVQSHRSVYSTVRDMSVYSRFRSGREVVLSVLPMFNNFGATPMMLTAVFSGATLVIHERWNTDRVLEAIKTHGATFFSGTPTMLNYMLKAYDPSVHDLSSLRLTLTGGAPVSAELLVACQEVMGMRVRQIYGSTETCGHVVGEPVDGVQKPGSAGTAIGCATITIVDEHFEQVPTGVVGEVVVGGDTLSLGYWRDPETTAEAFSEDGWRSGDLGYLDEDGYLFVVDRKKDIIISGGFNIYPLEVENVLCEHPSVTMAAVVGMPDPALGEVPVAFVVPSDDPDRATAEEMIAYAREHLAVYKAPRRVVFVDEFPLGPSGKVLKRELRDAGA